MSLGRRNTLILLAYAATLLGLFLGGTRVLTYHEVVFAQPAREMIRSGDWLVATHGGVPFPDKPPLTTWAIAASMSLFGSESEWVARLPIFLASVLLVLRIGQWAALWFGPAAGLYAGLVQASAFYVLMQARLAEADMLLALAVTEAYLAFSRIAADNQSPTAARSLHFALAVTLAFFAKGPIGVALIAAGCFAFLLVRRDLRSFRFLMHPAGLLLAALLVGSWIFAAVQAYPELLEGWRKHNLDRFTGALHQDGRQPFYFYLYMAPLLVLPWTPFVLTGLLGHRRTAGPGDRRWLLLACWFLADLALLSTSAWKHKHYLIPALPALSLWAGVGIDRFLNIARVKVNGFHRPGRRIWAIRVAFATVWIAGVATQLFLMPHFDSYRDQARLAERINRMVPEGEPIDVIALPENQIFYYLRFPQRRLDEVADWSAELLRESRYVLGPAGLAETIPIGRLEPITTCDSLRKRMEESDRLTLFRFHPPTLADRPRPDSSIPR